MGGRRKTVSYILIVLVVWANAPAMTQVDFSSKESCETAKSAAVAEFHITFGKVYAVCVAKQ